jgi:hypothetical protein
MERNVESCKTKSLRSFALDTILTGLDVSLEVTKTLLVFPSRATLCRRSIMHSIFLNKLLLYLNNYSNYKSCFTIKMLLEHLQVEINSYISSIQSNIAGLDG